MIYEDDPQRILMASRFGLPTLEKVHGQVQSLARVLVNLATTSSSAASATSIPIPTAQARSLDSDFVVSSARNGLVFYTLQLTASRLLTGTDSVAVDLMVDGFSVGRVKNLLTVTLALGVGITTTQEKILLGFVPANSIVNLTTSGSGSAAMVQAMEILL